MGQETIEQAFGLAVEHHQAGRLRQAEGFYRQVLERQPDHADALHLLGVVALQAGQYAAAVELIGRAVALRPNWAEAYSRLGIALKESGRLDEAIAAQRRAVALAPHLPEGHNNLGHALFVRQALDDAIAAFREAIALKPDYAEAHSNLGVALKDKGRLDEAIAAYRQAIALKPNQPEAYNNLGNALAAQGQLDEAIVAYRRAIELAPRHAEAFSNLGHALRKKGALDEAIACQRQAVAINPGHAAGYYNLGNALREKGQLDEAIAAFGQAVALQADYAEAHSNLGMALQEQGRIDEAIAAYGRALAARPQSPDVHFNMALAALTAGDFAHGWKEHEWRWQAKEFPAARRNFAKPQWDGGPLAGATLLLHAEQGFGDTIQFIRYVPLAGQRGGSIIIECQGELRRLVQGMAGSWPVVAKGHALGAFDYHCPLLSLPGVFDTRLESIPRTVPYVTADAGDVLAWSKKLGPARGLKVGVAWAGKLQPDPGRSIPLAMLAPWAQVAGVEFYSLQKGEIGKFARQSGEGLPLIDWTDELHDFADTAALMANLDLVISIDTAVAHLAGAMGKPVWVMLPFAADWRWMRGRADSPWYPSMRLFRQARAGDWGDVVMQVAEALSAWKSPPQT
jgi:tetratricopeptide (TPR) repeat protein